MSIMLILKSIFSFLSHIIVVGAPMPPSPTAPPLDIETGGGQWLPGRRELAVVADGPPPNPLRRAILACKSRMMSVFLKLKSFYSSPTPTTPLSNNEDSGASQQRPDHQPPPPPPPPKLLKMAILSCSSAAVQIAATSSSDGAGRSPQSLDPYPLFIFMAFTTFIVAPLMTSPRGAAVANKLGMLLTFLGLALGLTKPLPREYRHASLAILGLLVLLLAFHRRFSITDI